MVSVRIIAVGRLKEKFFEQAYAEYVKRLSGFCRLDTVEVAQEKLPDEPSDAQTVKALGREGEAILAKIPQGSYVVPLCIEGRQLDSEGFAKLLDKRISDGQGSFTFIIGGSFGLADTVKAKADFKLSMSPMTFPHRLARIMLAEQLYRAFSIASNRKYHK